MLCEDCCSTETFEEQKEAFIDKLVALLDDTYELVYVDRGSQLDEGHMELILRGDTCTVYDEMVEWESDSRSEGVHQVIDDLLHQHNENCDECEFPVLEWHDLHFSELPEAIYERDSSDPLHDLLGNTPPMMFTAILGEDTEPEFIAATRRIGDECLERVGKDSLRMVLDPYITLTDDLLDTYYYNGCEDQYVRPMLVFYAEPSVMSEAAFSDGEVEVTGGLLWASTSEGGGWIDETDKVIRVKASDCHVDSQLYWGADKVFGLCSFHSDVAVVPQTHLETNNKKEVTE